MTRELAGATRVMQDLAGLGLPAREMGCRLWTGQENPVCNALLWNVPGRAP